MISLKHLGYAKTVVKYVTNAGVLKIVHEIITNNIDPAETKMDSIKIWAGTGAIAGVLCAHASARIDDSYDEAIASFAEIKEAFTNTEEQTLETEAP